MKKNKTIFKTVKIKESTHARLASHAKWTETLDDALNRILDEWDGV